MSVREDQVTGSNWLAYVAPFAVFLIATQVEPLEAAKPYYPWLYGAKILAVAATCLYFRRSWPAWSTKGLLEGVLFGVLGVVAWVLLANLGVEEVLRQRIPGFGSLFPDRVAYNPLESIQPLGAAWGFVVVRFIGLALLVPIIEELFWRGFLSRYLIDERFERVVIGTYTTGSFLAVTALFAAVHPELLAAIIWGAGINLLLYRTKNIWACVIGHAVTNFLLGVYVMSTGTWRLW